MPVLLERTADPSWDIVIQAESLRSAAVAAPVFAFDRAAFTPMLGFPVPLLSGEQTYTPMQVDFSPTVEAQVRTVIARDGGVATSCGAWLPAFPRYNCMLRDFVEATSLWIVTGTTRDSAGAALDSCRVVAFEVGRIQRDGAPVVAEALSDGSGNFSLEVPLNVAYWLAAYKPGAPDVGGVSLLTVVPVQV